MFYCSGEAKKFTEPGLKIRYFLHANNFTYSADNFTFPADNFTFPADPKILVLPHLGT
jgi:hypothetical protein